MTLKQAIKFIVSNWERLKVKEKDKFPHYSTPKSIAVWVAKSDIAESYEVDEEWIGISPQGNIFWAYASGCSCWDGEFAEVHTPTLKELKLEHKHTPEDWEKAIIKFAETEQLQELPSYNRYDTI